MAILLLLPEFEFAVLLGTPTKWSVTEDCVYVYVWEKLPASTDQKQFLVSFTSDLFYGM